MQDDVWLALLRPWCAHLQQVAANPPTDGDLSGCEYSPEESLVMHVLVAVATQDDLRRVREAIELLAIVVTLDNRRWLAMLVHHCGCEVVHEARRAAATCLSLRFLFQFNTKGGLKNSGFDTAAVEIFFSPFDEQTTRAEFKQALRGIHALMTPAMRATLTERREYLTTLIVAPQRGMKTSRVEAYVESVVKLVKVIVEQSAVCSLQRTRTTASSLSEDSDWMNNFCFMLERGELKMYLKGRSRWLRRQPLSSC